MDCTMTAKILRTIPETVILGALLLILIPWRAAADGQYLVVNIIPGEAYEPVFKEIAHIAPGTHAGHPRAGIAAIFSYLDKPREKTRAELMEFLGLSEKYDIPVVIQLDGEQWWGNRPDLWNWWDPGRPGYDTANRQNVEWSGWGPDHALKIAWRNWGRQIRVLPPPNLMSARYRAACHDEMRILIPLVLRWWSGLPAAKKHLLIGIKLGWESSIGVNAFYIPGGDSLLDTPEQNDPHIELRGDQVPDRGVAPTGYAAVSTAHLATSGPLEESDLAEVVSRHLEDLCALASDLGVPRRMLFTHVGGWKEGEILYDAALNRYSCPGWSFYRHAGDPSQDQGVMRVLRMSDAPYWAAVEWLLEGKHDAREWTSAIVRTLAIPRCRYLCIYNWSGIRNDPAAVEAVRSILTGRN
jgi:hypothetical protein